jgi:hypothetical protein
MPNNHKPTNGWACPECFSAVTISAFCVVTLAPDASWNAHDPEWKDDSLANCVSCDWEGVASESVVALWPNERLKSYQGSD